MVKDLPVNSGDEGDSGLIPGSGRSPRGGHGNLFQYSGLKKPHGQRTLTDHSPKGHKELDTERLSIIKYITKLLSFPVLKDNHTIHCRPWDQRLEIISHLHHLLDTYTNKQVTKLPRPQFQKLKWR